jgi:hypothetical protein
MTASVNSQERANSSSAGPVIGSPPALRRQAGFVHRHAQQELMVFLIVLEVALGLAMLDLVERRLGDVHVAALDQFRHLAVEQRQQQGTDVRAVNVRIGHDDDAVIAQLFDLEFVLADAGAERGDQVTICSLEISLSKRAFSTFSTLPRSGRMAWNLRSRPCLAEPPAESPSTM